MNNKFRVWCKNKNQWETDYCVLTSDGVLLHRVRNMWVPLNRDAHIVVFSTGLNDKNGKEIFKGDIVKDCDTGEIKTVVWNKNCIVLRSAEGFFQYSYFEDEHEIIGNIFENSEPLGEVANGQH